MRVRFSREAEAEVEEAHGWYDDREPGLGGDLRAELTATIEAIRERPERHRIVSGSLRRAMLRRFPYLVVYEVLPDCILILGFVHGARHPRTWRKGRGR